jgi:Methylase of polypeptide chain release factors
LKLLRQDVFKFHSTNKFDLIISNPPYLKLSDYINLDKSIKQYEPKEALIGDSSDGTMFYKKSLLI